MDDKYFTYLLNVLNVSHYFKHIYYFVFMIYDQICFIFILFYSFMISRRNQSIDVRLAAKSIEFDI